MPLVTANVSTAPGNGELVQGLFWQSGMVLLNSSGEKPGERTVRVKMFRLNYNLDQHPPYLEDEKNSKIGLHGYNSEAITNGTMEADF